MSIMDSPAADFNIETRLQSLDFVAFQQLSDEFYAGNINLVQLCRLCLASATNNAKMFPLVSTDDSHLCDKLSSFTTLQIHTDDGLPQNVCELCQNQIISCHEFKQKCEKSNTLLESLLNRVTVKFEPNGADKIQSRRAKDVMVKNEEDTLNDLKLEEEYLESLSDDNEILHIVQNEENMKQKLNNLSKERKKTKERVKKNEHKIKICPFSCGKKLLNLSHMKEHIKTKHTTSGSHLCGQCKETFVSEEDLQIHSAVHAAHGPWKCNQCHKEYQGRNQLRRHIQWHMGRKRYSCECCDKCFVELYALKRHMRVHTGEIVMKKYPCEECGKRFVDKRSLATHQSSHSGLRPFPCDVCGNMFPSRRLLESHARTHTDRKPHKCTHCDKRFRHESTRNTHIRTHTGERPYVCSVCGKTFIQNSNLTLHMRTHTGERPYPCSQCDKRFTSGSSLKLHLRSHTGEKPYSCKVCGKRFARKNLNAHMLRHTGERPFPCAVCHRTFTSKSRLVEHSRSHTGEKPFVCNHCNQGYTTKSLLKKHSTSHTKKKLLAVSKVVSSGPAFKKDENIILQIAHQPIEVGGEIIVESEIKTEILVVRSPNSNNYHTGRLCLSSGEVEFVDNIGNNVNLVTVDSGNLSISTSSGNIQGTAVKLFQIDDGILEIAEEQVTSEI